MREIDVHTQHGRVVKGSGSALSVDMQQVDEDNISVFISTVQPPQVCVLCCVTGRVWELGQTLVSVESVQLVAAAHK